MKYILCFAADIDTADIALVFNVEPASVRTVRYRIKKKINKENAIFSLINHNPTIANLTRRHKVVLPQRLLLFFAYFVVHILSPRGEDAVGGRGQ